MYQGCAARLVAVVQRTSAPCRLRWREIGRESERPARETPVILSKDTGKIGAFAAESRSNATTWSHRGVLIKKEPALPNPRR